MKQLLLTTLKDQVNPEIIKGIDHFEEILEGLLTDIMVEFNKDLNDDHIVWNQFKNFMDKTMVK